MQTLALNLKMFLAVVVAFIGGAIAAPHPLFARSVNLTFVPLSSGAACLDGTPYGLVFLFFSFLFFFFLYLLFVIL